MIARLAAPHTATLERLAHIHEIAFAPTARGWTMEEISALARDCDLYVGQNGFTIIREVLDEAEVLTIAVAPRHQRSGEGRALLTHVLAQHQDSTMFLEVAADNEAALELYKSCGFAEVGRRKGYYERAGGAPVDALTMRRSVE